MRPLIHETLPSADELKGSDLVWLPGASVYWETLCVVSSTVREDVPVTVEVSHAAVPSRATKGSKGD